MRIAFSGAHAVGKSTLIAELGTFLRDYEIVDEPYVHLIQEGVPFSDDPSLDDFEAQLEHALTLLATRDSANTIFDRCPIDFLAYLSVLRGAHVDTVSYWLRRSTEVTSQLDLVVFVSIERPDRIHLGDVEHPRLRKRVDHALRQFLVDDALGLGLNVLEASGSVSARVRQVLDYLRLPRPDALPPRNARSPNG